MKTLTHALGVSAALLLASHSASAALIGWQTFENCGANNNTGICDATPDTNSSYDATPVGSASGNTYLTGRIGAGASSLGRDGRGQNTSNSFLNGPGFGDEGADSSRLIVNHTLADGSAGARIGPNGGSGTSSWKFGSSANERTGDFQITNNSDYFFRLEFFHYDARMGNANSPATLELKYLATGSDLIRQTTGVEYANLVNFDNRTFAAPGTQNISRNMGAVTGSAAYLAPGASASFRFIWSNFVGAAAESQIDNLAIEGSFFETAALLNEINPLTVQAVPVPAAGLLFASALAGLFARKQLRA